MGIENKCDLALQLLVTRSRTCWLYFHSLLPLTPSCLSWTVKNPPFVFLSLCLFVSSSLLVLSVSLFLSHFSSSPCPWADGQPPHASTLSLASRGSATNQALFLLRQPGDCLSAFSSCRWLQEVSAGPPPDKLLAHDEKGVLCSSELMHRGRA